MTKSSKSVLIVSDMHVGSTMAICSPEPTMSDLGSPWTPNELQKELFRKWEECIDEIQQKPELLVENGEPCDGANKKNAGQQTWSSNLGDQLDDAKILLDMIPHKAISFVRGSNYHTTQEGTNFEELIAKTMPKIKPYKSWGGTGYTDYYLLAEMNGVHFNFTHHVGFNKWAAYRTTAIAREMAGMVFERDKMGKADIIVRSHVHYFVHVEFTHTHGFTTPAWKFPDAHLFRGGTAGTTPDIGMVEVIVEPNGDVYIEKHIMDLDIKPLVMHL